MLTASRYPSSQAPREIKLLPKVDGTPCKFAVPLYPRIDIFLGSKSKPAVPVSLTPPLHVTPEMMTPEMEYALVLRICDMSVTDWLREFREYVIQECDDNEEIIGKELTVEALCYIAVKSMGEQGHIGVRVPQDSSPYPPQIQIATEYDEEACKYTTRAGTVRELVDMPREVLQGCKVVPYVQISHLWQESAYCGIAPRLARMIVIPPERKEDPFAAAGF